MEWIVTVSHGELSIEISSFLKKHKQKNWLVEPNMGFYTCVNKLNRSVASQKQEELFALEVRDGLTSLPNFIP